MGYRRMLVALQGAGVAYVIVGSVAAALHGASREPRDLDVVVDPSASRRIVDILIRHGFYPTLPLALDQVPVMRFFDRVGLEVDIFSRSVIPFEELLAGSRVADYQGASVRIASPAHLLRTRERIGR